MSSNDEQTDARGVLQKDSLMDPLLSAVRARYSDSVPGAAAAEQALISKMFERRQGAAHRWLLPALGVSAIGVLVAVLVVGNKGPWSQVPLRVAVTNATLGEAGYLNRAPAAQGTSMEAVFSDGSQFIWRDGARGRIRSTNAQGARLAVEDGTIEARVMRLPDAQWSVEAGPFVVNVTGTEFKVTWSGTDERFLIDLQHGSVTVRGPLIGEARLNTGQHVTVDLRNELVSWATERKLSAVPPHSSSPAKEVVVPESPLAPEPRRRSVIRSTQDVPALAPAWSELVSQGNFMKVIDNAESKGIADSIKTIDRVALAALVDAARYARRFDIAEPALLAAIQRFPQSIEAEHAGFFLGRISDETGRLKEAVSWYDVYLERAPNGSYVAEALGRKMIALSRANTEKDSAAAHVVATMYLQRFPSGAYAGAAQKLLQKL